MIVRAALVHIANCSTLMNEMMLLNSDLGPKVAILENCWVAILYFFPFRGA